MNYFDEGLKLNTDDDKKSLGLQSRNSSALGKGTPSRESSISRNFLSNNSRSTLSRMGRQSTLVRDRSRDDESLLQDIIDHDDEDEDEGEDDDDDDDDDGLANSDMQMVVEADIPTRLMDKSRNDLQRRNTALRSSAQIARLADAKKTLTDDKDITDSDSDEDALVKEGFLFNDSEIFKSQVNITADNWQNLSVHQDIKELFSYILKYTPQTIGIKYHLQPFIPEYVPAVGDVDAFLKVTTPPHLKSPSAELEKHLTKLGLCCLDEPSGDQSEPSLLNMKLRSVLTDSGNSRTVSASSIPIAKSPKDIDKWIAEVEQVHLTRSVYDGQLRKDIDKMHSDWPRSLAGGSEILERAYQQCQSGQITLLDYIRIICEQFEIEGPLETQTDFLLCIQTIFAMYLLANQSWE